MNDEAARAVAPIDTKKVQPISATGSQPQPERSETPPNDARLAPATHAEGAVEAAVSAPGHRTTDLAYQVDAESKRVSVRVVDRATGEVVRSFPIFLPGQGALDGEPADGAVEADAPRGALVDAKA